MVGLAREEHAQHRRTDALLGRVQGAGAFGGEGEQGDGGVDGVPFGGAERGGRPHGERGARAAAGAEAVQLHPVVVLGPADDGGRGRGPLPQPFDLGGDPGGAAAGPIRRGGDDGARGVVQRRPAVDLGGERAEHPLRAGVQRLLGQLALGGEACRDRPVLVGGDGGGHGLADGEEGGAAGHLQQRQPLLRAGVDEGVGDLLVVDPDGEPQPDHPRADEPPHIPPHGLRILRVQLERGDQQQLAALHVGDGVGQLADVRPADGHVQAVLARAHGQLERGVVDERGESRGHGAFTVREIRRSR